MDLYKHAKTFGLISILCENSFLLMHMQLIILQVNFLTKLVALKPGKTVQEMLKNVMLGKDEGADDEEKRNGSSRGVVGRVSILIRKIACCIPRVLLQNIDFYVSIISPGKSFWA